MEHSNERRRYDRITCRLGIKLGGEEEVKAYTVDLSESGIRLVSDHRFMPMSRYELVFGLSPNLGEVKCVASVVWLSKLPGEPEKYEVGFVFSDLTPEDVMKLRKFIGSEE